MQAEERSLSRASTANVRKWRHMFTIDRKRVKEHLGLVRLLVAICSAAVGGLFLRFVGVNSDPGWLVKASGFLFVISILFLCLGYKVLIDHQDSVNNIVHGKRAGVIYGGLGCFLGAMILLVLAIF